MRRCLAPFLLLLSASLAHARLGETEAELIVRFGKPTSRSKHSMIAQGKMWDLGPTLRFTQDDWRIETDMIDGKCARIHYGKRGEWTDEQIATVLTANAQGLKWTQPPQPGSTKLSRKWSRPDGAIADWNSGNGMWLVLPILDQVKQATEAKAKAEISGNPKV